MHALTRSIASSIATGPTLQLQPMTCAPHSSSLGVKVSGVEPSRQLPSSSMVTWATIGRFASTSRAAIIAWWSSSIYPKVSRISRSTPPSTSALICSRKVSRASSKEVLPKGSILIPNGPTEPATHASKLLAASRARRAPVRFMSFTLSPRLCRSSRKRFPPKVLVSMISAPDCKYWWCSERIRSGCNVFNSS